MITAAVAFNIGVMGFVINADDGETDRFYINSSVGAVVFEHQKHYEKR